jgi:hypothetical protein
MTKYIITESQYTKVSKEIFREKIKKIGEDLDVDWSKISLDDLIEGTIHEMEHGSISPKTNVTNDNLVKTLKIALAHLEEDSEYYQKLKKIEEFVVPYDNKLGSGYEGEVFKTSNDGKYVIKIIPNKGNIHEKYSLYKRLSNLKHKHYNTPLFVELVQTKRDKMLEVGSKKIEPLSNSDREILERNRYKLELKLYDVTNTFKRKPENRKKEFKELKKIFQEYELNNTQVNNILGILSAAEYILDNVKSKTGIDMHADNIMQDNGIWKLIDV